MSELYKGIQLVKLFPGEKHCFSTNELNGKLPFISEFIRSIVSVEVTETGQIEIIADQDSFATFSLLNKVFMIYPKILPKTASVSEWAELTELYFVDVGVNSFGSSSAALFGSIEDDGPFDIFYFNLLKRLNDLNKKAKFFKYQEIEEEVAKVRGRVNFSKSIIKFPGLYHKMITNYDEGYILDFFAPVLKSFVKRVQTFVVNKNVLELAEQIILDLNDVHDIELTNSNIEKCRKDCNSLRMDKKEVGKALDIIQNFIRRIDCDTELTSGFSLKMDHLFQDLVYQVLGKIAKTEENLVLKSGNNRGENLSVKACGKVNSLSYTHNISFQPDAYFKSKDLILTIFDAKYKSKIKIENGKIKGLSSPDLYQMIAYAITASEINLGFCPRLQLIYPMRDDGPLFEKAGAIKIVHQYLKSSDKPFSPEIEIVFMNVKKAMRLSSINKSEISDLFFSKAV